MMRVDADDNSRDVDAGARPTRLDLDVAVFRKCAPAELALG